LARCFDEEDRQSRIPEDRVDDDVLIGELVCARKCEHLGRGLIMLTTGLRQHRLVDRPPEMQRPWMYATTSGASGWPPADAAAVVTSAPTMKTTARFIDASSIADTTESHASRKHRPLQALYGIRSCQAQVICRAHCAGRNILGPAGMSFSSVNRQDCLQERRSSSRYKSLAVIPIRSDRRPHAQRRQVRRSERRSG
jgi:hypothetical protein